jgi:hypothetical protein
VITFFGMVGTALSHGAMIGPCLIAFVEYF